MHCQQFEQRINDLLDERSSPARDPAVREHARHCGRCADLLRAYRSMVAGLRDLPAPELENDLSDLVVAKLSRPQPQMAELVPESPAPTIRAQESRSKRLMAWLRPLATLAAGVLIVVGVYRVLPIGKSNPATTNSVVSSPIKTTPIAKPSPIAISRSPVHTLGGNQMALADHYNRLAEEAEQLAQRQMAVASEVADGLRPVADSMNAAINVLRPAPRTEPRNGNGSGAQLETLTSSTMVG